MILKASSRRNQLTGIMPPLYYRSMINSDERDTAEEEYNQWLMDTGGEDEIDDEWFDDNEGDT